MLRFLPFYFTFLTMLCAPVEFARAESWVSDFLGLETCFPMSESEWQRRLGEKDPDKRELGEVDRVRAQRSGLLERQCAETFNWLAGGLETTGALGFDYYLAKKSGSGSVTMQTFRSTRDLLQRRGSQYLTPEELLKLRKFDPALVEKQWDEDKLKRIPGAGKGVAAAVQESFLKTVKNEKSVIFDSEATILKLRRKETGQQVYTKGPILEFEVNDSKVDKITGANGDLPDYVKSALRNLSASEVESFNANRYEWPRLGGFSDNTPARSFWYGVVEGLKPPSRQGNTLEINAADGKPVERTPELIKAFQDGKAFVAKTEANRGVDFDIKIAYGKEKILIDGKSISRENFIPHVVNELDGRVLTGRVGAARPPHQRAQNAILLGLIFAHGLNNLYVAYSGINHTNADLHGDFCPRPYCNDDESSMIKPLPTKMSVSGLFERAHSAIGARRDQQAPPSAEPAAPAR